MAKGPRSSYLLRQVQLANYQQLDRVVQEFGLTPSQYTVLGIINEHPEGIFSAALARRLGVTPQSGYELLAGLERRGLIRRSEDATSRRVLMAGLTPKGAALLAKCEKAVERFERRFFQALSAEEIDTLRGMLERLARDNREKASQGSPLDLGARPD